MGLWGSQQGFSLGNEWWMGSCCFHVFYCLKHMLRLSDSSRITLCSSCILMKNKTKKEPSSVPLPAMEISAQKSSRYYFEGQMLVTGRLSGWRASEALCTQTPGSSSGIAILLLMIYELRLSQAVQWSSEPGRNLWPIISETLKKLTVKFPSPVPPVCILLVSRYWWLSTGCLKEGLASCILALLE